MNLKKDYFKLKENKTTVKTEIIAGITMFMSMAFMLIVTTNILGDAGINKSTVFIATALGAAIICFLFGALYNKVYIAGPSTGIITFITYTIVQGMGLPWEIGILAVTCASIILLLLGLTNLTENILDSIPDCLKYGISVGIGLLITFIGLQGSGIIVADPNCLVGIGDLRTPSFLLTITGVIIIGILMKKNVKSAILIGMIVTYILGIIAELTGWYVVNPALGAYSLIPTEIINLNIVREITNSGFNISNLGVLTSSTSTLVFFIVVVFIFLFIDITGNLSTVIGVDTQFNQINSKNDENYKKQESKLKEAVIPSAIGSIISSLLGTTSMIAYLETLAGISVGGRTGLAAIVTGICLLLCLIFSPIITILPQFVVAPAIIIVGFLMISNIKDINFTDITEGLPAFLTFTITLLSYNIGEGIIIGIISYVLLKALSGNYKEIKKGTWILFIIMIIIVINIKFIYPI